MIYDGEYKWSTRHDRPDVVFVPGWPVLLAGVYKVFGIGHHVAVFFGMLFSLATPFLLYGLARRIWSEKEGRLAMLAGFLMPSYGLYHLSVLQEVLFVPLAIAIAWSAVHLVREFSYPRLLLLAGLVCLGTYERQSAMAFLFLPPTVLLIQ